MDVETFRAVARSSPWLWASVELTRRLVEPEPRYGDVHAWIRRPKVMRVEETGRPPRVINESTEAGSGRARFVSAPGADRVGWGEPPPVRFPQDPGAPQPVRRADGLVARRPTTLDIEYDDPMFNDYRWVAMLDPRELADGSSVDAGPDADLEPIEVLELTAIDRRGRETLDAIVRPTGAYDPRCACCPLLYCAITDAYEGQPVKGPGFYADAYRIQLDRSTGICVSMTELGGQRPGTGFDVTIHAVDVNYPDTLFA